MISQTSGKCIENKRENLNTKNGNRKVYIANNKYRGDFIKNEEILEETNGFVRIQKLAKFSQEVGNLKRLIIMKGIGNMIKA